MPNLVDSGGDDFKNFVDVLLLFQNYLPSEKGVVLHLNKLESPSPFVCLKFG